MLKRQQIHNYQQLNLKNKLSKQAEQEQNHRYWRSFGGLLAGRGKGENAEKGAGINKHKLVGTE